MRRVCSEVVVEVVDVVGGGCGGKKPERGVLGHVLPHCNWGVSLWLLREGGRIGGKGGGRGLWEVEVIGSSKIWRGSV